MQIYFELQNILSCTIAKAAAPYTIVKKFTNVKFHQVPLMERDFQPSINTNIGDQNQCLFTVQAGQI